MKLPCLNKVTTLLYSTLFIVTYFCWYLFVPLSLKAIIIMKILQGYCLSILFSEGNIQVGNYFNVEIKFHFMLSSISCKL